MRTIRLQIAAATETHCGGRRYLCKYMDASWPRCNAFPDRDPKYDTNGSSYFRLPECIAAEKEAGK